jgi:K+-transporting ATPase ATPase C chain
MFKLIFTSMRVYLFLALIVGLLYPLLTTLIGSAFWKNKTEGSLLFKNGQAVGSTLIAQAFTNEIYFWPRPSAGGYATIPSGASSVSSTSDAHRSNLIARAQFLRQTHPEASNQTIPSDLLTTSGSGLDPHLSPDAVQFQISRVVKARHFSDLQKNKLSALVAELTEEPIFGIIGERQINVLLLNSRLDDL